MNQENTPLVSVIIGNYNYGRFIAEAINSVLAQTYKNFELIVVDDGSTDNSREVISSYGDRLTAIFQENGGQGAAFNSGIAHSKGEIICFLDSDDYYREDKVEKVVAAFAAHPKWVQISHGRVSVEADGTIIGNDPTFFSHGDVTPLLLKWGRYAWAVTSALSYRRSVLEKVVPIPKHPKGADTFLTATVPFYGQVGFIQEPLMFYRKHGSNMQARAVNIPYFIQIREDTQVCINTAASKTGKADQLDISRDADYRSYTAMSKNATSIREAFIIAWITILEAMDIGQPPKDTVERLLRRCICSISARDGELLLRYGPKRYLKHRFINARSGNASYN